MYFCPGANDAPHHAPKEWSDKYKGKFDIGYEKIRETILERQKKLGIVPASTELTPINPYADQTGVDGTPWPESDTQLPGIRCRTTRRSSLRGWRRCTPASPR